MMAEDTTNTNEPDSSVSDNLGAEISEDQLLNALNDSEQMESLSQNVLEQMLAALDDDSIPQELQGVAREAFIEAILDSIANGLSPQEAALAAKSAAHDALYPKTADNLATTEDADSVDTALGGISIDAIMAALDSPEQLKPMAQAILDQILEARGDSSVSELINAKALDAFI